MLTRTIAELQTAARESDDASGYFPAMYSQVTAAIAQRCAAGRFRDPVAMAAFAERFADYYLDARRGRTRAPRCWTSAWDVADDDRLLVVQHLLLGINAHVNYDLPRVVVDLADGTGDLSRIRPDFDAVNDVLAQEYRGISRALHGVARWTNAALLLGGGRAFNFSLRVARQQAWTAAQNMSKLDAGGREAYAQELDELVSVLAFLIAERRFPRSLVTSSLRICEERDPRRVTAALLAPVR